jgi:hypothetical protein
MCQHKITTLKHSLICLRDKGLLLISTVYVNCFTIEATGNIRSHSYDKQISVFYR